MESLKNIGSAFWEGTQFGLPDVVIFALPYRRAIVEQYRNWQNGHLYYDNFAWQMKQPLRASFYLGLARPMLSGTISVVKYLQGSKPEIEASCTRARSSFPAVVAMTAVGFPLIYSGAKALVEAHTATNSKIQGAAKAILGVVCVSGAWFFNTIKQA